MTTRLLLILTVCSAVLVAAQTPTRPPAGTGARPDPNRFEVEHVIAEGELDEPMVFALAPDGRAYVGERHGALKVYQPSSGQTKVVTTLRVFDQNEQGLIGVTLDPGFATNRHIYVQYSDASESAFKLVRLTLTADDAVVAGSERTVLTIPVDRAGTNHTGGGMVWDSRGNLYLAVGNNTGNSQLMQSDERPGRHMADDQRGAANSNDLRGKILRIHPEPDGTYTVPPGNLFRPGTPNTRPEIYTMGHRNVWRVSLDSRTGHLYWGEIGPDQAADTEATPRGYDEFNRATRPGFFGWPYFVGNNQPLRLANYADNSLGDYKDPARPTNTSVNNTGLRELPAAQPALIYYPFNVSDRFPELGSGARCAVGGPVFRRADFAANALRPWPAYYEGKWLITDCTRAWVKSVTMTDAGEVRGIEDVVPGLRVAEPMDIKFGSDGDLYVLDYGSTWNAKSPDAKLIRIKYQAGNRAPVAVAAASVRGGTPPFTATLSAQGSRDYDGDPLTYAWSVASADGPARAFTGAAPLVSFDRPGRYTATLTVTDAARASSTATVDIVSGNSPPVVTVTLDGNVTGNRMFFAPGRPLAYRVDVRDSEDGTLGAGIDPDRVALSIDYVPEGLDPSALADGLPVDSTTRFAVARTLVNNSDCRACHQPDIRTRGPSMKELGARYQSDSATLDRLATKVRSGGTSVWGAEVMPAHPALSMHEARTIVTYMLSAAEARVRTLPLSGTVTPVVPADDAGRGALLVRAVYTDQGRAGVPALTSEAVATLRAGGLSPLRADSSARINVMTGRGAGSVQPYPGAVVTFRQLDLTGVRRVGIGAQAQGGRNAEVGGTIELRRGSASGPLLGSTEIAVAAGRGGAGRGAATPGPAAQQGGPLDGGGAGRGTVAAPAGAGAGGRGGGAVAAPLVRISVPISPVDGLHDLVVVFKNDKARSTDLLMTVVDLALFFGE